MGKYNFYAFCRNSFVVFLTFAALAWPGAAFCADATSKAPGGGNQIARANQEVINNQLRNNSWTFGQSMSRNEAIWKKGVAAKDVQARATGRNTVRRPEKLANGNTGDKHNARRFPGGVVMESHKSTWKVNPEERYMSPGEEIPRESRHVLRAFADVAPSDNLDINIGPELILKDENYGDQIANSSQPDSILGLGMNFKLDF